MNLMDIVIIYLAFGSPLAVYKYLQSRNVEPRRRIIRSILTFFFWIPEAVRLGYRYLSNAYFDIDFVSPRELDSSDIRLGELREKIRLEFVKANVPSLPSRSIRETLERYVGLTLSAGREPVPHVGDITFDLFDAAGRPDDKLAAICLMRRNQRRIGRHHIRARRDFLGLFEELSSTKPAAVETAIHHAIQLARELEDRKAANGLEAIAAQTRDEVWNPQDQQPALTNISASVPLSMKTAPLNND